MGGYFQGCIPALALVGRKKDLEMWVEGLWRCRRASPEAPATPTGPLTCGRAPAWEMEPLPGLKTVQRPER